MSARSIARAHERDLAREQRRLGRRAKQAGIGATLALGAGIAMAPAAQAASFQVNALTDGPSDTCAVGTCTLRDAITDANANGPGSDTITFASGLSGEITLDGTEGFLPIYSAMAIQGPGTNVVSISGDSNTDNTANAGDTQIAYIDTDVDGAENDNVSISGLTLKEGYTTNNGGAVYSYDSDLTISNSRLADNSTSAEGGALYSDSGTLTILGSTLTGNSAYSGGALYTDDDADNAGPSDVVIRNSTIDDNEAVSYSGGAAYFDDQTDSVLIEGSTISDNTADDNGGGIRFYGPEVGAATLRDSTVSGNTAGSDGGGISDYGRYDAPIVIQNSTVADNDATTYGGGIYREGSDNTSYPGNDTVTLSSAIVAGNTVGATGAGPDLYDGGSTDGSFTVGFSLIGTTPDPLEANVVQSPPGSNLIGVNPQLGPLANNGGPTETQRPATASRVVDAGIANGLSVDQRGFARTTDAPNANASGSDGTDIGAVELQAAAAAIDTGPDGATRKDRPSFTFSSPSPGATFECQIDGAGFAPCSSPKRVGPLADGKHLFEVRATSSDGLTGPVASRRFTVDTKVKGASAIAKKTQKQKGKHVKVKVTVGANEKVTVRGSGSVQVKHKRYKLKAVTKKVGAKKRRVLKLKPAKKVGTKRILKALDQGQKARAKLKIRFTDSLGNKQVQKRNVRLK